MSMALTVAASLAQIGEFSFIVAGLGVSLGLMSQEGYDLILAGAILSITLNPLVFWAAARLKTALSGAAPNHGQRRFATLSRELDIIRARAGGKGKPATAEEAAAGSNVSAVFRSQRTCA